MSWLPEEIAAPFFATAGSSDGRTTEPPVEQLSRDQRATQPQGVYLWPIRFSNDPPELSRRGARRCARFRSAASFAFAAAASPRGLSYRHEPERPNDDIVGGAPIDPVQSQALPPPDGSAQADAHADADGHGPGQSRADPAFDAGGSAPSNVGISLRNAADLALSEAGTADVTLLVKDDQSTPDGATAAAQSALTDGADLIIGPLYAANVRAAEQVVSPAHKPMIAFSTDASTAEPGVYLLSFLVESYVDRIVDFAASKGKRSFAALIPDNDYGRIAAAEFQQVAARRGVRVMEIENYDPQIP